MLISKCQACPNWVLRFGPQFLCHPLPSPPPTNTWCCLSISSRTRGRCRVYNVDPLLALFQAKPVISAGKFSHPKVQIMAGSVWAGYWPPSWPPQVGHLHTVQVATKLVIDVPANSKTPISHQSIQLINSRLFPLAGLTNQQTFVAFSGGSMYIVQSHWMNWQKEWQEGDNFTLKQFQLLVLQALKGLDAEHMLVRLIWFI